MLINAWKLSFRYFVWWFWILFRQLILVLLRSIVLDTSWGLLYIGEYCFESILYQFVSSAPWGSGRADLVRLTWTSTGFKMHRAGSVQVGTEPGLHFYGAVRMHEPGLVHVGLCFVISMHICLHICLHICMHICMHPLVLAILNEPARFGWPGYQVDRARRVWSWPAGQYFRFLFLRME